MVDWNQFKIGAATQPLPDISAGTSSLQDADPAIYQLLAFLTYVVRTYPGPRILQEAAAANLQSPGGGPILDAVANAYPYDPLPEFLENQIAFPLLYIARSEGQTEQWTVGSDHDICGITVSYVLPPCDSAQCERMIPMLKAVYDAVRRKVNDAWDPGYTPPGGTLGMKFTDPSLTAIEEIGFGTPSDKRVAGVSTGVSYGRLPGTGDIWFPCVVLRGYITERDEYAPTIGGPSQFTGADITGNVKADDGTVVPAASVGLVQVSTQLPPSISGLSVTTGPSSGGTAITVTGARFLAGPPTMYFGPSTSPQYAASVAYVNSTTLTITTPSVQGGGVLDLTIVNRDGQSSTLTSAFTFTE